MMVMMMVMMHLLHVLSLQKREAVFVAANSIVLLQDHIP